MAISQKVDVILDKKTFHNISTNIPGSTQGRICCLIAEDEENSKEVIFKRNLWTLAMCFIYFTYNLYFTRRIKKYLAGQCPNMRRVGKCHISFKGRVGLPNRMNFRKNPRHMISRERDHSERQGCESTAIWNLSKNLSVLVP